jgi:hypothetical protein
MVRKTKPVTIGKQTKNLYDPKKLLGKLSESLKKGGVASWNRKKRSLEDHNEMGPKNNGFADADFSGLDLKGIDLSGFFLGGCNFRGCDLTKADLRDVQMWQADFEKATLTGAKFSRSDLRYSSFFQADLQDAWFDESNLALTNFERAKLTGVDFSFANLSGSNLKYADISGSIITGVSTWNIEINEATIQNDLIIEPWYDPLEKTSDDTHSAIVIDTFKTNDIETGQLLYLLTSKNDEGKSEKLKTVLDSLTDKIVLILGRFADDRIKILEKIRSQLAEWGYVPVIFDFPEPKNRDLIETVAILAGLSRFVIADLTNPSSTPLEALLIISAYCVPFAPIIEGKNQVFPLFESLKKKYDWVLDLWHYKNKKQLVIGLRKQVVDRCEDMRTMIKEKRMAGNIPGNKTKIQTMLATKRKR